MKEEPTLRIKSGANDVMRRCKVRLLCPQCWLFEVHGSELKPDPVGNLGQASVLCIPHGMLLFGVRKDPFDGLLAPLVQLLIFRRIPDVVRQLLVALPDMPLYRFHTIFGMGAQMAGGAVGTNLV